jgi:hypothetical protein
MQILPQILVQPLSSIQPILLRVPAPTPLPYLTFQPPWRSPRLPLALLPYMAGGIVHFKNKRLCSIHHATNLPCMLLSLLLQAINFVLFLTLVIAHALVDDESSNT